ncbi:hypothetical protein INT44_006110, partial [Umbelopsis vinacea]
HLAQQSQMLQKLLSQGSRHSEPFVQDKGMLAPQPVSHELPVRPSYEWQPPQELYTRVRSLSNPIFKQTLTNEERKGIIERYPAMEGLKYPPPSTVPEAQRRLHYSASAILRPFDTLCHELLQTTASDESRGLFAIVYGFRKLILRHCGDINNARVNLALRAVNPTITVPDDSTDYILEPSKFQETLAHHTKYQKIIKNASIRRSKQVFSRTSLTEVERVLSQPPSSQLPIGLDDFPTHQLTTVVHTTTTVTTEATQTTTTPANTNGYTSENTHHSQTSRCLPFPTTTNSGNFQRQKIADLLHKRAIELVQGSALPGFYIWMFVTPKKNGGFRPVFNLRSINQFLQCPHFKMESIQQVIKLIRKGDYFTSVDFTDAFLHILIHRQFRRYLRFHWEDVHPPANAEVPPMTYQCQEITSQPFSSFGSPRIPIGQPVYDDPSTRLQIRDLRRSIREAISNPIQAPRQIHSLTMRIKSTTLAIFSTSLRTKSLMFFKNNMVKTKSDWDKAQLLPQECLSELRW